MNIESLTSQLKTPDSILSLSQDMIFFILVAVAALIIAFTIGRNKIVSILFASYISTAVIGIIPEQIIGDWTYRLGLFIGIFALLMVFARRSLEISFVGSKSSYLWQLVVMSALTVIMILSIVVSIFPMNTAGNLISMNVYEYLVSPDYRFVWFIAPLLFLFFIQKKLAR